MAFKGGGGSFKPKPKVTRKKKPAPLPPAVREAVQSVSSTAKRTAKREEAASDKRVAKATPVLKSKGIGGLPNQQKLVRRTTKAADAKVEKAIRRLPTESAREDARLEARRGKEQAAREGVATGTVRAWKESYDRGELMPPVSAAELASAIRQGYGKVGGKHGLQQKAELEITPEGDIGLVGRRKFLPDTRQVVVPKEYKPYKPKSLKKVDLVQRQSDYAGQAKASTPIGSAAAKTLEVAGRPSHAVASLAAGEGGKGAVEALKGRNKITFGKILKDAGLPTAVAATAGFGLDVVTDPTTYVTFGAGSAGRKAAQAAAEKATSEALKKGLSKKAADRAGRAAAAKVIASGAADRKGVSVGVRAKVPFTDKGIDVKTSGRASSAVAQKTGVAKAASKARRTPLAQGLGKSFNPDFRPNDVSPVSHRVERQAERRLRAGVTSERQAIRRRMKALDRAIPAKQQQAFIDAIEANKIDSLPADLQAAARTVRRDLDAVHASGKARGIEIEKFRPQSETDAQAYFPHIKRTALDPKAAKKAGAGGRTRVVASKGREIRKPLSEVRKTSPDLFEENVPKVVGSKLQRESERRQLHDFWQKVAKTGRPLSSKATIDDKTEMVYRVEPSGLTALQKGDPPVLDRDKVAAALKEIQQPKAARPGGGGQRIMYHVVRDSGQSAASKLASIEKGGLKPSSNGFVYLYDDLSQAEQFARTGGRIVKVNVAGLHLGGAEGAATRTVRGVVPRDHIIMGSEAPAAGQQAQRHRYVILNREQVDGIKKRLAGMQQADEPFWRGYDRLQGGLKKAFTLPNPSYHMRNLIGDSINAWMGDASAHSFAQSGRALKARAQRNIAEASAEQFTKGGKTAAALEKTLKLGKSGKTTMGRELHAAESHGAIGQGFIGRELDNLTGRKGRISDALQYREDWARFATYLSARKRGMTPSQSADWSLKHHFDYGDLTNFERSFARRAIPFWTFFARNTKLQVEKVFTRPGKVATMSKLLDEAALAAGFSSYEDYLGDLKDYEQRGLPIPIKVGGGVFDVQFAPPLTDLNQLTTDPAEQIQNIANRVTFFKSIGELATNYSVFFQSEIAPEGNELTAAPPAVGYLPGILKKKFGVQKVDGEWMWDRRADYAVRSLPEGNFALQQMLPERGTRNMTASQGRMAWLTGLKSTPHDAPAKEYSRVAEELHNAQVEAKRMRNRGQAADANGFQTKEYAALLARIRDLTKKRDALRSSVGIEPPEEIKARPLTPQEKALKRLEDMRSPAKSPQEEALEKLEKLRAGG